jgi:hypothetical protein
MTPSQYRLAAELVEKIHEDFQGFHQGYRSTCPGALLRSYIQGHAGGKEVEPRSASSRSARPGYSAPHA